MNRKGSGKKECSPFQAESTFSASGFLDNENRWEFVGQKADEAIRTKYIGKSVEHYLSRGAQNPIKYVNIKNIEE